MNKLSNFKITLYLHQLTIKFQKNFVHIMSIIKFQICTHMYQLASLKKFRTGIDQL